MGLGLELVICAGITIGVIVTTSLAITAKKISTDQRIEYKKAVIKYFKKEYPSLEYDANGGFTKEEYENMGIMVAGEKFHTSDHVKWKYNDDITFNYCEVNTENIDRGTTYTVYKGAVIEITLPQKLNGRIVATSNDISHSDYLNRAQFGQEKWEEIETDHVMFDKIFDLTATDPEEAFYIFTPDKMENFIELSQRYSWGIGASLTKDKICVFIPNVDLFEPDEHIFDKNKRMKKVDKPGWEALEEISCIIKLLTE